MAYIFTVYTKDHATNGKNYIVDGVLTIYDKEGVEISTIATDRVIEDCEDYDAMGFSDGADQYVLRCNGEATAAFKNDSPLTNFKIEYNRWYGDKDDPIWDVLGYEDEDEDEDED